MTLRLVTDNPEPVCSSDFADGLRALADRVRAGEFGDVLRIAMAIDFDGGLTVEALGSDDPFSIMGLLDAARMMTFAEALDD